MSKPLIQPVRLTADIVELIEAHPAYRPATPGLSGGMSHWIKEAIFERLGKPMPTDYHQAKTERIR